MRLLAIFGPTAIGKTEVAIAVAEGLRADGEDPVAVSCDALQVYAGLETLTGAPTPEQRARLEHRLVGVAAVSEEFSAGRFAQLAHAEIDLLLASRRRPIVVGGTGLYLRAALAELELRPPVPAGVRAAVEAELAERGSRALHSELEPEAAAATHPGDGRRVARALELQRTGVRGHGAGSPLWTASPRHPTLLVGLTMAREALVERIDARVEEMIAAGAAHEVGRAREAGASRTASAALGFAELEAGDAEGMKRAHRAYARRQMTWMRKLRDIRTLDVTGRPADSVAAEIVETLALP